MLSRPEPPPTLSLSGPESMVSSPEPDVMKSLPNPPTIVSRPGASRDEVVASAAVDGVVTAEAEDAVAPLGSGDRIARARADDDVGTGRAAGRVVAHIDVNLRGAESGGAGGVGAVELDGVASDTEGARRRQGAGDRAPFGIERTVVDRGAATEAVQELAASTMTSRHLATGGWLPMSMSLATDGTPALLTMKSMCGPGGTTFTFDGIVTGTPPLTTVNPGALRRWSM